MPTTRRTRRHPLIAKWLVEHRAPQPIPFQKRYDPLAKSTRDFMPIDWRILQILETITVDIERQGAKVKFGVNGNLIASIRGEEVEFRLREKLRQVKRPLTSDEKRWRLNSKDWKQEDEPTGLLAFSIESYVPPDFRPKGSRSRWEESVPQSLESMLPQITAAISSVAAARRAWHEEWEREAERKQAEQQASFERKRARLVDQNRWRRLIEIAQERRDADLVRVLIATLEQSITDPTKLIGEKSVAGWIEWARERANSQGDGLEVFRLLDQVDENFYPGKAP